MAKTIDHGRPVVIERRGRVGTFGQRLGKTLDTKNQRLHETKTCSARKSIGHDGKITRGGKIHGQIEF